MTKSTTSCGGGLCRVGFVKGIWGQLCMAIALGWSWLCLVEKELKGKERSAIVVLWLKVS